MRLPLPFECTEDVSELSGGVAAGARPKNEKRREGVAGTLAGAGGVGMDGGNTGDGCGWMPMSFIVAFMRSRSRLSFSSSCVSSLRALPVTPAPGFRVSGRRFGFSAGFLSPLKREKLFQSKERERR
jgi:hypothetical protein